MENRCLEMYGSAKEIAQILLSGVVGVEDVILFGSVARGEKYPKDLDLLVSCCNWIYGDTEYDLAMGISSIWLGRRIELERNSRNAEKYGGEATTDEFLSLLPLETQKKISAVLAEQRAYGLKLQIVPIVGDSVGIEEALEGMWDKYFFQNISKDALSFDKELGYFVPIGESTKRFFCAIRTRTLE